MLSKLEALIDPFDFNVFHPYLMYYLERQKQRANVRGGVMLNVSVSVSVCMCSVCMYSTNEYA